MLDRPYFMKNRDWYYFDGERFVLTDKAPEEAKKSLAEFYEEDVTALSKNLGTTLEPLMMLLLGVIVGFLLIALYLPVFQAATATPG